MAKNKNFAKSREARCPIVAIGSSAGGVSALQALFEHMPADLGVAFVVVAHMEPSRPSELVHILSRRTKMPVEEVRGKIPIRADRLYVIAPNLRLALTDGHIEAREFDEPRGRRAPIDHFFRSLAEQHGDGLAIVLTGAGTDGSLGVRAVKDAGGVVLVQDPRDAEYGSMPRSAIATGVADIVAPLAELPRHIEQLARGKHRIRALEAPTDDEDALKRLLVFLRARTGHDFSQYKKATIKRRLMRRMQLSRKERLEDYFSYLRETSEEVQALFSDLLISVTSFFRDPAAFKALSDSVFPQFFEDLQAGPIRLWISGCATGEEAYSVAILALEEALRRDTRPEIQIFATDLDQGGLAAAREGRYPLAIEADVSDERLRRFFTREGDSYRVRKEVRDLVVFASHSMVKDPPFSRLDFVSCRNLLIYLEREVQGQVLATLRYALKPNGFLFLGSAETADIAANLFRIFDREHRIYQAMHDADQRIPVVPRISPIPRLDLLARVEQPQTSPRVAAVLHREALEKLAPPSILVDATGAILHLSETAGRYLLPPAGPLTSNISDLARPELRLDIRAGLHSAFEKGEPSVGLAIPVKFNGAAQRVFVQVKPVKTAGGEHPQAIIFFFEGGEAQASEYAQGERDDDMLRQVQEDLQHTRERLRASREEYEAANEELRAANEELQSINEEYRSTGEELETSKEELQSMNEELQTLNTELKLKLEGVSSAHSDMQNLMAATEVGTLFLDTSLRIKRFTPRVADLFRVTANDEGRPITDFTHSLKYKNLEADALAVLNDLVPRETESENEDGRWFQMRLRPYRTLDDRIDGVVVTLVDVTERKQSEERLRTLTGELDHRVKNVLARVLALSELTQAESAGGPAAESIRKLAGRIRSMAKTHAVLSRTQWSGADLKTICETELEPYRTKGNVRITGPSIFLSADAAQAITHVMHELTTNAAKFGALSSPKGRVALAISTSNGADGELHIEWRERDGPAVAQPSHNGYGSGVILDSLAHELEAKVNLRFAKTGLECDIAIPLASIEARRTRRG